MQESQESFLRQAEKFGEDQQEIAQGIWVRLLNRSVGDLSYFVTLCFPPIPREQSPLFVLQRSEKFWQSFLKGSNSLRRNQGAVRERRPVLLQKFSNIRPLEFRCLVECEKPRLGKLLRTCLASSHEEGVPARRMQPEKGVGVWVGVGTNARNPEVTQMNSCERKAERVRKRICRRDADAEARESSWPYGTSNLRQVFPL